MGPARLGEPQVEADLKPLAIRSEAWLHPQADLARSISRVAANLDGPFLPQGNQNPGRGKHGDTGEGSQPAQEILRHGTVGHAVGLGLSSVADHILQAGSGQGVVGPPN